MSVPFRVCEVNFFLHQTFYHDAQPTTAMPIHRRTTQRALKYQLNGDDIKVFNTTFILYKNT